MAKKAKKKTKKKATKKKATKKKAKKKKKKQCSNLITSPLALMDISGLPAKAGHVENGRLYQRSRTFHFF